MLGEGGAGDAPVALHPTPAEQETPIKGISCGLVTPGVLSVIWSRSVCGPSEEGENFTVIAQLPPEFKVEPHELEVMENCVPA